ncbi:MAG: HPr-rel-A system PqqD family peptide chaperone [Gammaproteobacteria bacterium]|nr:HPr-rel-A system PqqD family peptide chaperone [Gammaproteobacteria bacterium]
MNEVWQIFSELTKDKKKLEFIDWGINISVYNPFSGDTHLLNLFPFEILQFLLKKPASLYDIAEYSAILCDEEHTEQWNKKVLTVLEHLKALELIDYQNKSLC